MTGKRANGVFPECVARVPVSFGGEGVRLCSRKVVSVSATICVTAATVFVSAATVCVSAINFSTLASASGVVPKACQVDWLWSQLYGGPFFFGFFFA